VSILLTKQDLIKFCRCPKLYWLEKKATPYNSDLKNFETLDNFKEHLSDEINTDDFDTLFEKVIDGKNNFAIEQGNNIDNLAKEYFKRKFKNNYIDCTQKPFDMINDMKFNEKSNINICFSQPRIIVDGLVTIPDFLIKSNMGFEIVEVKSSLWSHNINQNFISKNNKLKLHYLLDITFQGILLEKLNIKNIAYSLMLLNKEFCFSRNINNIKDIKDDEIFNIFLKFNSINNRELQTNAWKIFNYHIYIQSNIPESRVDQKLFSKWQLENIEDFLDIFDPNRINDSNIDQSLSDLENLELRWLVNLTKPYIKYKINQLKKFENEYFPKTDIINLPITKKCGSSFLPPKCSFLPYCIKQIYDIDPYKTVFTLSGYRINEANMSMLSSVLISDNPNIKNNDTMAKSQFNLSIKKNQSQIVYKNKLNQYLKKLDCKLYFLDFEAISLAIPKFKNWRPLEQVPFQYSLHILEKIDFNNLSDILNKFNIIKHKEFIANPTEDPRIQISIALYNDLKNLINENAKIIAYHSSYEISKINYLGNYIDSLIENNEEKYDYKLLNNISKLFKQITSLQPSHEKSKKYKYVEDLKEPFIKGYIYHQKMKGSASIKNILPALIPTLSYKNLQINNGVLAMEAYASMIYDGYNENITKNLLKYCELDTFAMVVLLAKLYEISINKSLSINKIINFYYNKK